MIYNIFWFRRDLRFEDNTALFHALSSENPVIPIFIFDQNILSKLSDPYDARITFIYNQILQLQLKLRSYKSDLVILFDEPLHAWSKLLKEYKLGSVYFNRDYESYANQRDQQIETLLTQHQIQVHTYKDHVLFEAHEVLKDDGKPYTVFTPYKNKLLQRLKAKAPLVDNHVIFACLPSEQRTHNFWKATTNDCPDLDEMGFKTSSINIPNIRVNEMLIKNYQKDRDYPARDATTHLGIHLRFGTISIRSLANQAYQLSDTFFSELLWRDFYSTILQCFPYVEFGAFKKVYDQITWENNENQFKAWCEGRTGYPMVDAGMRQLNETGFMHNRLRMITASFLVKHLLIDWKWGEAYFAEKLLDFELASNNGGWQWAAGCGTDAAPYFRIFSPEAQQMKFDPDGVFVKKWIPDLDTFDYPKPIVEHAIARQRCIEVYKKRYN
ncbi:MAG: deoxyribodipyrimidine photo-lyase [Saprospiraceae bacterium]|nr:deoxyribodipyrimidine photo-lyase [Saprospiraceae bacterium]